METIVGMAVNMKIASVDMRIAKMSIINITYISTPCLSIKAALGLFTKQHGCCN
jgi:hypothetical protein